MKFYAHPAQAHQPCTQCNRRINVTVLLKFKKIQNQTIVYRAVSTVTQRMLCVWSAVWLERQQLQKLGGVARVHSGYRLACLEFHTRSADGRWPLSERGLNNATSAQGHFRFNRIWHFRGRLYTANRRSVAKKFLPCLLKHLWGSSIILYVHQLYTVNKPNDCCPSSCYWRFTILKKIILYSCMISRSLEKKKSIAKM